MIWSNTSNACIYFTFQTFCIFPLTSLITFKIISSSRYEILSCKSKPSHLLSVSAYLKCVVIRTFSLKLHLIEVNEFFVGILTSFYILLMSSPTSLTYWIHGLLTVTDSWFITHTVGKSNAPDPALHILSLPVTCSDFEDGIILILVAIKHICSDRHAFNPR